MRILFVCTGNICRSPTAERLTAAYAAANARSDLTAHSAGTRAPVGRPMDPAAAEVLTELGGDPHGFAARRLTPDVAHDADLIVAMSEGHRSVVLNSAPRMLRRTFTLIEAARLHELSGASTVADLAEARVQFPTSGPQDIMDPVGSSAATFSAIGTQISELLAPLLQSLRD